MPHRRDAVDVAVRESARRVREPRRGRSTQVGVGAVDVVVMIVVQCVLLVASMGVAWFMLGLLNFEKKLRVMGLYGCTHKTVAMGVHGLGVPRCCGAFTPSTRLVSIRRGRGWFIFRV